MIIKLLNALIRALNYYAKIMKSVSRNSDIIDHLRKLRNKICFMTMM